MPDSLLSLTRELCAFPSGVVAPGNDRLFTRLCQELPFRIHRYASGLEHNGWTVPMSWRVVKATLHRGNELIYDGTGNVLAVAQYAESFEGELDWEQLKPRLVTNPDLPQANVFHCMWQYRPWQAEWALCLPHEIYRLLGPGRYRVCLRTEKKPGHMLVAEYTHQGTGDQVIVFNNNTCHPHQANDGLSGAATLIRLMQWLRGRTTRHSYKLVLGPEHLGSVFYLRDRSPTELNAMTGGLFLEMTGTPGDLIATRTFSGNTPVDRALHHVLHHYSNGFQVVPWRTGAGNDETVWEAPGYEVPFIELTRRRSQFAPYPEYHSSADTPYILSEDLLAETLVVLQKFVDVLEQDAVMTRRFDGLICLSNPQYDLYMERPDPSVVKDLPDDAEKWGALLDSLFRYFDGTVGILEVAEKHDLPFERLYRYLSRFREKGLIHMESKPLLRHPISQRMTAESVPMSWTRTTPAHAPDRSILKETWQLREGERLVQSFTLNTRIGKHLDPLRLKQTDINELKEYAVQRAQEVEALYANPAQLLVLDRCPICATSASSAGEVVRVYGVPYVRCPSCGHTFVLKQLRPEILDRCFRESDTLSATYTDRASLQPRMDQVIFPKLDWVVATYEARWGRKPQGLVDVGAGGGHFVAGCHEKGFHARGFEINGPARRFARKAFNVQLYEHDFRETENLAGVEIVTLWGLLEYVDRPQTFLEAAARVMGPESLLVIEVPRIDCLSTAAQSLEDAFVARHLDPGSHLNLFSDASLMTLIHSCGFTPVAAWYFGMDAYELLTQLAHKTGSDLPAQLAEAIPRLQSWLDHGRLCDDIIIAAIPQNTGQLQPS